MLLLQLVFFHVFSVLPNPSLIVKLFLFPLFFLAFGRGFFLRWCYVNLVSTFFLGTTSFKLVSGKRKAVTPEMVAGWNETAFPTILFNYGLQDIYNTDKFGLFYQCLPDKSYHLKTEKCSGSKHSKNQDHQPGSCQCRWQ